MTPKKATKIQLYFENKWVRLILAGAGILLSIDLLFTWANKRFGIISVDWSIAFPSISLLLALFPVCLSIKDWFEKKLDALDGKISDLEPSILMLKDSNELAKQERNDIYKKLLKLEARVELTITTVSSLKTVVSDININRAIIDKFREEQEGK